MRPFLASLTLIPLLIGTSHAEDLAWRLGKNDIARYRAVCDPFPRVERDSLRPASREGEFLVRARDLVASSRIERRVSDSLHREIRFDRLDVFLRGLVLMVPPKHKGRVAISETVEGTMYSQVSFQVKGHLEIKEQESGYRLTGMVKLKERYAKRVGPQFHSGNISWLADFDKTRGLITKASYKVELKGLRGHPRAGKARFRGSFELKEVARLSLKWLRPRIEAAIKRGVGFLRTDPEVPKNSYNALFAFALLRSGVKPEDKLIRKHFAAFEAKPPPDVYGLSLAILAYEARWVVRQAALESPGPIYTRQKVSRRDLNRMSQLVRRLLALRRRGAGCWGYGNNRHGPKYADNSCTQFAVLALQAAARSGVEVPLSIWRECFQHFITNLQKPEGRSNHEIHYASLPPAGLSTVLRKKPIDKRGWPYKLGDTTTTFSMTAAGLSSLIIAAKHLKKARAFTKKMDKHYRAALPSALQWLAEDRVLTENSRYYRLYSLEKACELLDVKAFGEKDWYLEGALSILKTQSIDGGFGVGTFPFAHRTAIALLFLNRATLREKPWAKPKPEEEEAPTGEVGKLGD